MRGRVLSQTTGKNGYRMVALTGGKALVHRLVLEAFVGPCPDGMEACHNDSDRTNNVPDNLRWDTRYGNCQDIRAAGTHWQTRKTRCPEGHPYDGLARLKSGREMRFCRRCRKKTQRAWEARQRHA